MKNKLLANSLFFLLLVITAQNAFNTNSIFYGAVSMLQFCYLLLIVLYCGKNNISYIKLLTSSFELQLLSLFTFLILIALLRSSVLDVIPTGTIIFDIFFVILIYFYAIMVCASVKAAINYLFFGIFLFLLANIVLLSVGIENTASVSTTLENATILQYVGYEVERVLYPLYSGAGRNNIGVVAGALLCYIAASLPAYKNKYMLVLASVVPLWVCFTADTRGPLLSFVLSLLLYYLIRKHNFRSIRFLPFAIPLFPFLVLLISYLAFESGVATTISREGGTDVASGRSIIWLFTFDELSDFKLIHLVGYGLFGQAVSGVSYDYMNMFRSWPNENLELLSLHNFAIQMVFDIGYFGLILFIYLMYRLLTIAIDSKESRINILAPVLIFIILCGMTEITPLLYSKDMFVIFYILSTYLLFNKNTKDEIVKT